MSLLSEIGLEGGELILKALATIPNPFMPEAEIAEAVLPHVQEAIDLGKKLWNDVAGAVKNDIPLTAEQVDTAQKAQDAYYIAMAIQATPPSD